MRGFTGGGWRRAWFAFVFASTFAVAAALATAAAAGVVTQREHAPLRTPTLNRAEQAAITLNSITTVADPSLGLIVTATFNGEIERYLGRGGLKTGLVALELVRRSARATPAGMADKGGGFSVIRVPIVMRTGKSVTVGARTVALFNPEQVLHVHTPPEAGVVRARNQVVFYLGRAGLSQVAMIKLKVFARSPTIAGRHATAAIWRAILKSPAAQAASVAVDQTRMTYYELPAPAETLAVLNFSAIESELLRQEQIARALRAAIRRYAQVARAIVKRHTLPKASRSQLVADLATTAGRIRRLKAEERAITSLVSQIGALIRERTPPPVQVVQTDAGLSQEMAPQPQIPFSAPPPPGMPVLDVNDQVRYQRFAGIGAAMTDSSAWLIYNKMSSSQRAALMQDLFGQTGTGLPAPPIHLNFLRVGVAATGAMTVTPAYSYDDMPAGQTDPNLTNFSVSHDLPYIIPTLQQALQINPGLEILASPWSPPGWMKSNDALNNSNNSGSLLAGDYDAFARYLVKFIQAYQSQGIPISAMTPNNEPTASSPYPGLNLPEANEAQFIAQNLKPALSAANLSTRIYGTDLSWDRLSYASPLTSDPNAGPDVAGTAWHCYFGSPTVMTQLQQQAPSKDQIVDECSPEIRSFGTPEFLISALRNWATSASIWSVALDPNGNPIQTPNHCGGCRGAVSIDQTTGAVTFLPKYYQLGQVSAFVQPGATRIDSPNFVTYGTDSSNIETISSGLDDVAFLNPDGSKVLIANNNSSAPITFGVGSNGSYYTYTIPAQAMTTFVWR
jgi:glucosylceramidase